MFRLIVSPRAQNHLKKIKKQLQLAVKSAMEDIKENPFMGKSLSLELTGKFSYRVNVYRIIYKVNAEDKVVNILSARHRSIAYN